MKIRYAKLNPTRNMTAIVLNPVSRADHARIAAQMMADAEIGVEQVGFLEDAALPGARIRLQMMGGEFCGNATMSVSALLARQDGLPEGETREYPLEVSGAEGMVLCQIQCLQQGYRGTVSMPVPEEISSIEGFPLVRFPGISHVIVPENAFSERQAAEFARKCCLEIGADAFGVLLADENLTCIRPLVYVRGTDSGIWECGCGSGTAAIGAYAASLAGHDVYLDVRQPGGVIQVQAGWENGAVHLIRISGMVKIESEGEFFVR